MTPRLVRNVAAAVLSVVGLVVIANSSALAMSNESPGGGSSIGSATTVPQDGETGGVTPTPEVDPADPGGTGTGATFDATVESSASVTEVDSPNADPSQDAGRIDPENPDSAVEVGWPGPESSRCSYVYRPVLVATGEPLAPSCLKAWVCGGERIDDVVSGDIAGADASGNYALFLDQMIGLFGADSAVIGLPSDVGSVNDYLLGQGLAAEHGDDEIPVFYYCGQTEENSDVLELEVLSGDPTRIPRFGWDTDIQNEYNIPGLREDVLIQLQAQLGFYTPELAAVPPIENSFTWVKWPTWFWVKSSLDPLEAFAQSDAETFRLDMRAVVDRVEWTYGGQLLQTCTPDQMVAYNEQAHDPVADVPACNHRFTQAVSADLEATIYFSIEERVRRRNSSLNDAYPDSPWYPHPDSPELSLSTVVADYRVREIYSVNTPINMTDEEIAELLRNE